MGPHAALAKAEQSTSPGDYTWVDKGFAEAETYSGKASDISRNLAFVGIGLVLLLGGVAKDSFGGGQVVLLPKELMWAGSLMFFVLLVDLAQYIYGDQAFRSWAREEQGRVDDDQQAMQGYPPEIPARTRKFFAVKILALAIGYAIVIHHLSYQVSA